MTADETYILDLKEETVPDSQGLNSENRNALWDEVRGKKDCDVIVKIHDEEFHCHASVLSNMTPYFMTKFSSEKNLPGPTVLEVKDIKSEDFRVILKYMYLHRTTVIDTNVISVLNASRLLCTVILTGHIREVLTNVCLRRHWWLIQWRAADEFNWPSLKASVTRFMAANFKHLPKTKLFMSMTKDELCRILSWDDLHVGEEKDLLDVAMSWMRGQKSVPEAHDILSHLRLYELTEEVKTCLMETLMKEFNVELSVMNSPQMDAKQTETSALVGTEVWSNLVAVYTPKLNKIKYLPILPKYSKSLVKTCIFKAHVICASDSAVYQFQPEVSKWKELPALPSLTNPLCKIIHVISTDQQLYVFVQTGEFVTCLTLNGSGWKEGGCYNRSLDHCSGTVIDQKVYISGWHRRRSEVVEFNSKSKEVKVMKNMQCRWQRFYSQVSITAIGQILYFMLPDGDFGQFTDGLQPEYLGNASIDRDESAMDHVILSRDSRLVVLVTPNPTVQKYRKLKSSTQMYYLDVKEKEMELYSEIPASLMAPSFGTVTASMASFLSQPKKLAAD